MTASRSRFYEDPGSYEDPGPYEDSVLFGNIGKNKELDFYIM